MAGVRVAEKSIVDVPAYKDALLGNRATGSSVAETDPSRLFTLAQVRALLSANRAVTAREYAGTTNIANGTNDATAAIAAAVAASVAGDTVYFPAGTFRMSQLAPLAGRTVHIGYGATLLADDDRPAQHKQIDVSNRSDVTIILDGTLDGNRAEQSNDEITAIHSFGGDRVRVLSMLGTGVVTGYTGNGVWLRDGDDLAIDGGVPGGLFGTDCGWQPFIIEGVTAGDYYRPTIRNVRVDRTAEDFSGIADPGEHTGCVKLTVSGAGARFHDALMENVFAAHSDTNQNVAVEAWSSDPFGHHRTRLVNVTTVGPRLGIGISIAKGADGQVIAPNPRGAKLALEIADCTRTRSYGGAGDCTDPLSTDGDPIADSKAATIDNANEDGVGNAIIGFTARNFADTGIKVSCGASADLIDALLDGCDLETDVDEADGIVVERTTDTAVHGASVRMRGDNANAITAFNGAHGFAAKANRVRCYDGGNGIRAIDCTDIDIDGNDVRMDDPSTGAAGGAAYVVQNVVRGQCVGGKIKGAWTQGCNLIADGSGKTIDHVVAGGWVGEGAYASINTVAQNSGTFGTHNRTLPIEGYLPGDVQFAWFSKLAASYTDWVFGGGIFESNGTSTPASAGLFGGNGSKVTVVGHGTASNNVDWQKKDGTWTAMV